MRSRLIGELEAFVDSETGISAHSMAVAPTLCAVLGHGHPDQALHALPGIERRSRSRDMQAAFAHMGIDRGPSTAEDRLNDFATDWARAHGIPEDQSPSSRTVRRWSKLGAQMLVEEVIEVSALEPPSMQIDVLHQPGGRLLVLMSLYWMHGYELGPPRWMVVGSEEHAVGEYTPADLEEISPRFFQPRTAVEFGVGLPVLLRVTWLGETQPTFQVRHIEQEAGLITMSVLTPGGVGTVVYRDGNDIDALADIAAPLDEALEASHGADDARRDAR